MQQKQFQGVYSDKCLYYDKREISNNLTLYLKELEKEHTRLKVSRKKETAKIRVEINGTDLNTIEKINVIKSCFF